MRLVVDANILYSVALKTDGLVADMFFNAPTSVELCAPALIRTELSKHRPRMAKQMRRSVADVTAIQELLIRRLELLDPELIPDATWTKAEALVRGTDPDDEDYVALALHLKCPLWTGDKKLIKGLQAKGFKQVLSTEQVRSMLRKK